MPKIQGKQISLDTNPSLGSSDVIISSQRAIKQYVDSQVASISTAIYTATIDTGASSPFTITHNLNTFNYFVTAYDALTKEDIILDINRIDSNNVDIYFNNNPNGMVVLILASSNIVSAGTSGSSSATTYSTTITGDNSTTIFPIIHNLSSYDVMVQVFTNGGSRSNIDVGIDRSSINEVDIVFDIAPSNTTSFRVLINKV